MQPGSRIAHFEILGLIGSGGMGEVYRARDTRLGRDVAIKVLPPEVAADPDRLRRFEQETRAVAALNHPNILAIHDVGTAEVPSRAEGEGSLVRGETLHYLVTELLEGESLRARLEGGALPARKVIELAAQVATGLAAAHERGVVHRDLKPENLFITSDGHAKILDFGLAKLRPGAGAPSGGPPPTVVGGTEPGIVMGTPAYMSPEQVRGEVVDHRSDIFSFGVVLFEALTGKQAFARASSVETMTAILKEEPPDVMALEPRVPPGLVRIVQHCLEKRPGDRFQSARDLAFNLGQLSGVSLAERAVTATPGRPPWLRWIAVAAGVAALGGVLALTAMLSRRAASRPVPSFSKLSFRRGYTGAARFAPDGETVVYFAEWDDAPPHLYLKRPDAPDALALELPAAFNFAVSSRGELALVVPSNAAFGPLSPGILARAPLAGGAPREIVASAAAVEWTPEGSELAVVRDLGGQRRLEFPPGKVLFETAGHIGAPRFSPDGKLIAFENHLFPYDDRGSVAVVDRSGHVRTLTEDYNSVSGIAWSPGGDEIWFAAEAPGFSRSLYAVTTAGRLRLLLRAPGDLVLHDVSRAGRVVLAREDMHYGLLAGTVGEAKERDLSWLGGNFVADITADGRAVLFTEGSSFFGADYAICLRRTDGSPPAVLGKGSAYALSPDGAWALGSLPSPEAPLQLLPTGPGEAREIKLPGLSHRWATFFPDGRSILFEGYEKGSLPRLYRVGLDGGAARAATPAGMLASRGTSFSVSPDGNWIATTAAEPGVWLYAIGSGERRKLPNLSEPSFPIRWSADGQAVVVEEFGNPARIVRVDVATGARILVQELKPAEPHAFPWIFVVITPDEKTYAYQYIRATSELYLVEGLR